MKNRETRIKIDGDLLEELARAVHEDYCDFLRCQGYRYGPRTDASAKTHDALLPYDQLPAEKQEQNRQNARDISQKLASAGYAMVPAGEGDPVESFPQEIVEMLARREHVRWVKAKLAQPRGWRYGIANDPEQFIHADLVPWQSLPAEALAQIYTPQELSAMGRTSLSEEARDKDRILVKRIPAILARAGYRLVRLDHQK